MACAPFAQEEKGGGAYVGLSIRYDNHCEHKVFFDTIMQIRIRAIYYMARR